MADFGAADLGGEHGHGEAPRAAQPGPIENLDFQMRAFEAAVGPQDWTRYSETAGFTVWLAGASRVSPTAPMLGLIWRAALLSLIRGGPGRFELLQVAGAMSEADAAVFLGLTCPDGVARGAHPSRLSSRRVYEFGLLRSVLGRARLTQLGARLDRLVAEVRAVR